jgi:hypothetical protein
MRYLKEVTDDWKCEYNVPNHTYIVESGRNGRLLGYIKEGSSEPLMFPKPFPFFRKNRKFKEVKV